jgi:hypothetical protein
MSKRDEDSRNGGRFSEIGSRPIQHVDWGGGQHGWRDPDHRERVVVPGCGDGPDRLFEGDFGMDQSAGVPCDLPHLLSANFGTRPGLEIMGFTSQRNCGRGDDSRCLTKRLFGRGPPLRPHGAVCGVYAVCFSLPCRTVIY